MATPLRENHLNAKAQRGQDADQSPSGLLTLFYSGGARLLTSRLARTLAPPKVQIDPQQEISVSLFAFFVFFCG